MCFVDGTLALAIWGFSSFWERLTLCLCFAFWFVVLVYRGGRGGGKYE